ncbi:hypothetical protein ASL11_11280 [Paenibacillus sp. Soil750]|nr:hypothetical protein ASL11_11280 [Paenibacillus sp. Soil750]
MERINLTLDKYTLKMLALIALEHNTSRSDIVRKLVQARILQDRGIIKDYSELISKNEKSVN